jgi:hypothetical protein
MTPETVQERISDYCRRYQVTEMNTAGFPIFPAGLRETQQHREWIALYQLFNRSRRRSGVAVPGVTDSSSDRCAICERPVQPPGSTHDRCAAAVDLVRELGPESADRVRAAAFPDERAALRRRTRKKV